MTPPAPPPPGSPEPSADARAEHERLALALVTGQLGTWDWEIPTGAMRFSPLGLAVMDMDPAKPATFEAAIAQVHPDDQAGVRERVQASITELSDYTADFRVVTRRGELRWISSQGRVVASDDGQPLYVVGVLKDVTVQKNAEAQNTRLEARLRDMQKMEAVGTLAGGIAHDFNNLLAVILGHAAMARADASAVPAALQSLDQIERAAVRGRTLVQQILAFSRRQPQSLHRLALVPLVQETLQLLRATLPSGVVLRSRLDAAQGVEVLADGTQLQQVLMNLCTNAWHAIRFNGHVDVSLDTVTVGEAAGPQATAPALAPGRYVRMTVRDDGSGMPEAVRQRVFEPFFTTKPLGQGTGLGLSVVHGIVAAHGGTITVDSVPGVGSTFHVDLPLLDGDAAQAAPTRAPPLPLPDGKGRPVLYVDDDEVVSIMVERLLQRHGYAVRCLPTAAQALQAIVEGERCELVITDHDMPAMSGLELARRLRHLAPALPVVIGSGSVTDELCEQAAREGVRAVIGKAHLIDELGALLRAVFGAPAPDGG